MVGSEYGSIEITSTPRGDAPEHVRHAWVGVRLLCYAVMGYPDEGTWGIVSRKKEEPRKGVKVPAKQALEALNLKDPSAAKWFYQRGLPEPETMFFFAEDEFRIISGVRRQKILVADDMETGVMELPGR